MQEKTLTGGRSYYLDIARAIAIISISLNHAVNRTYDNYFGQMEEFLESSYLSSLLKSVVTVFSHLGVPLFLMISGALLLHKRMETADDVKRFYRHNLLELFITAEIWYFIMYWFVFFNDISSGYWEAGLADTLLGCVKTMLFSGSEYHEQYVVYAHDPVPVCHHSLCRRTGEEVFPKDSQPTADSCVPADVCAASGEQPSGGTES